MAVGKKRAADGTDKMMVQLPPFKVPTGNIILQDEVADAHEALTEMVNILYDCPKHCHHLLSKLKKRIKLEEEETERLQHIENMSSSTFQDWLKGDLVAMKEIPKFSDLTSADLGKAKTSDPEALTHIMKFLAQTAKNTELAEGLDDVAVRDKVLGGRSVQVKSVDALKTFKEDGGIDADGAFDWVKRGRYGFVVSDGIIKEIIHRCTETKVDISHLKLGDDWKQCSNWSDWEAVIENPPLRPQKLCSFFTRGVGPNSLPKLTGKQGYADHVAAVQAWALEVKATRDQLQLGVGETSLLKDVLQKAAEGANKQSNEKAQAAALKALALKRASRRKSLVE